MSHDDNNSGDEARFEKFLLSCLSEGQEDRKYCSSHFSWNAVFLILSVSLIFKSSRAWKGNQSLATKEVMLLLQHQPRPSVSVLPLLFVILMFFFILTPFSHHRHHQLQSHHHHQVITQDIEQETTLAISAKRVNGRR
jgi:hypothetical protein